MLLSKRVDANQGRLPDAIENAVQDLLALHRESRTACACGLNRDGMATELQALHVDAALTRLLKSALGIGTVRCYMLHIKSSNNN